MCCHPANIRLTCIAFANAQAVAKLAQKLHKKGSCDSSDRPSNFRDKTNVRLKRVLGAIYFTDVLVHIL